MTASNRLFALLAVALCLSALPGPFVPQAAAQPAGQITVRTNGGEDYNSKAQNVVHHPILPNGKFNAGTMWHSKDAPGAPTDLWVWLEFTFPEVVTLTAIRLHTEHEQRWHEANAARIEVAVGNDWREVTRGGIDSDDALMVFDAVAARVWRVHLMADHQQKVSCRGVQFYNGQRELYAPPSAPAPHPGLAARPLQLGGGHGLPVGATLKVGSEIINNYKIRRPAAAEATAIPAGFYHTHRETQTVTGVDPNGRLLSIHVACGDSSEYPSLRGDHARNGGERRAGLLDQRDYSVARNGITALQAPAATLAETAVMAEHLNRLIQGDPICTLLPAQMVPGRSYRLPDEAARKALLDCLRIPLKDAEPDVRNVVFKDCSVRAEGEQVVDGVRELHLTFLLQGTATTAGGMTLTFELTGAMGLDADRRLRRWCELGGPLAASGSHNGTEMTGAGWFCVNSFAELSLTPPGPPRDAHPLACPDRVRVLPVIFVPRDAPMPSDEMVERFITHLRLAHKRYAELLDGDTFEVASWTPWIVRGRYSSASHFMRDQWAHPELLERSGYTRFNCPLSMVIMTWTAWTPSPSAGGRPYNGSLNAGGGLAELFRGPLEWSSSFQQTLQHEIGHSLGMHHVSAFGYPQEEGAWIMSYAPETYWKGLEPQPGGTQRGIRPENLEQASCNPRAFTKFKFDPNRHVPRGYEKKNGQRPYGEAPLLGSPPWMFSVTTDFPSAHASAPGNLERHRLETNHGPNGYVGGNMWHTDKLPDDWCWLDVTFPMAGALSTIRIHTAHSLRYHQATAYRIEVHQPDGTLREVGKGDVTSDDFLATFPTTTARTWRIWLKAGETHAVCVRGFQFYWGRREIIPPPYLVPEHPGLAALPHPPPAETRPTTPTNPTPVPPDSNQVVVGHMQLPAGATVTSETSMQTDMVIKVSLNGQLVNEIHQTQDQAHHEVATVVTAAAQIDFRCGASGTTMTQAGETGRSADPRENRSYRVTRSDGATTAALTGGGAAMEAAEKLAMEQRLGELFDGDPVAAALPDRIRIGETIKVPSEAAYRAFVVGGEMKVSACEMALKRIEQVDGVRVGVFSLSYTASGEVAEGITMSTSQSGEYRIDLDRRIRVGVSLKGPATMKGAQRTADGLIGYDAAGTMTMTETHRVKLR